MNADILADLRADLHGIHRLVAVTINGARKGAFTAEHHISDDDFATDHWQTLFRIQYPEVR